MTVRAVLAGLRDGVRAARRIVRGVVGEDAYERYLAHHRAHHPDEAPLPEREFWRRHVDRQEANPGSRCC